ncbi:MAG: GNAT family N-acetyltransferase [Desulfobacterales bacterium]|nr:MAG: GNAT family N-acetyltransferase [Desulfobacterales bacterium]
MNFEIRKAEPTDHNRIVSVMKDWWGGRDLTAMLPKLFLIHFHDTALIAEKEHDLIGFLIGFLSQSHANEAYIYFVGVHPEYRKRGLAKMLYERFFKICQEHQRTTVRACTSPVNKGSIEFHKKM